MRKSGLGWYKRERLIEHFTSGTTVRVAVVLAGINKSTAASCCIPPVQEGMRTVFRQP